MSEPFIAEIILFGGNFAPRSWMYCHGQLLPIAQNTAFFSLVGTTYGGDGRTTFGVPELRGRSAMHAGTGPGLTPRKLGTKTGTSDNTLTTQNLASHNHLATAKLKANSGASNQKTPVNNYPGVADGSDKNFSSDAPDSDAGGQSVAVAVNNTGQNLPVNNLQPYLGLNYIICSQGIYPSRN